MKFNHTVKVAFSLNLWIENDRGHRVDAWILPVQCLFFWIPAWLYKFWILDCRFWIGPKGRGFGRKSPIQNPKSKIQNRLAWLFDLAGWKNDLPVILLALTLLLKERRFAAYA